MFFRSIRQNERGAVLIAVLIVSLAVAALAYTLLIGTLNSLERSDVQDALVKADSLKQGAIDETIYSIKQDPDYLPVPENPGILPESAGGGTNSEIKMELISNENTWSAQLDDFPQQTIRVAKAEYEITSYNYPDLYFVWGDMVDADIEYIDEFSYIRHFYDYHYNPYEQETDLVVSAGAEVDDGINDRVFSFGSQIYPADILRFQSRQNDAREPNELDIAPAYFESEHRSYDTNVNFRYWTVTYEHDPLHPGRNISSIDLMAQPGDISLDSPGDVVFATAWNGVSFDPPIAAPPNYRQGQYINSDNIFSENLNATTVRIGFRSDGVTDLSPYDYGFRVNDIRYYFDTDIYGSYYETPHPYDHLGALPPWAPGVQVVYSPFQYDSLNPLAATQSMRITFDWDFYLEAGDSLTVINLAAPDLITGILGTLTLGGGSGATFTAQRINTDMPLAIGLVLISDGDNDSSTGNYGYKVASVEYTDANNFWILRNDPVIETPHLDSLGTFINPFDPADTMMLNSIYQPHVPGSGTLDDWFVTFDEGVDLLALLNTDTDFIRLTTPGYDPYGVGSDMHYFVNPNGIYGWGSGFLGAMANYHTIGALSGLTYKCGLSPYLEIYTFIDDQGGYINDSQNWGFRVLEVGYNATDASDFASQAPTIAAAVSLPPDGSYPNFGSDVSNRGEWWITEKDVEMIGIHINLDTFDLDPGDYLVFYDETGTEVANLTFRSFKEEGPDGSGPGSDDPDGTGPDPNDPDGSGPDNLPGWNTGSVDLNETHGWVLVPGESVHIVLMGDSDDNGEHRGFEIDRTAWWSGNVTYDQTGEYERIHDPEKDFSDITVQEARDYYEIR